MICTTSLRFVALFAAIACKPSTATAQARPESVVGRVTNDSGVIVVQAHVRLTMAPHRELYEGFTDADGRYLIHVANGTGDYLIHVSAPGYTPFRKRVRRDSLSVRGEITVDAVLSTPAATELAAVVVQVPWHRPSRGAAPEPETGASEQVIEGVNGIVRPDQAGDLVALAATLPGVLAVPSGVSVLGLDPSQSRVTLNGMAFPSGDLPRDARVTSRVFTSSFDPAKGGFSGANLSVDLTPGGMFTARRMHVTLDAPFLQRNAGTGGSGAGHRFTRAALSFGSDGELVPGKWHFNVAGELRLRASDVVSVLSADSRQLRAAGIGPESADRLRDLLPLSRHPQVGFADVNAASGDILLLGRLDRSPFDPVTLEPSTSTWNVTGYARLGRQNGLGLSSAAAPERGAVQHATSLALQGGHSRYFGDGGQFLNDLRGSVSFSDARLVPKVLMPGANVFVASDLDTTSADVRFGGGQASNERAWTLDVANETRFHVRSMPSHRIKAYVQSRYDAARRDHPTNPLGTYSYSSIDDLAANRPSRYSRYAVGEPAISDRVSTALALGDQWRLSEQVEVLFGVRFEHDAYSPGARPSTTLDGLFGTASHRPPNEIAASPRLGFSWRVHTEGGGPAATTNRIGTFHRPPLGLLRGGIGMFRSVLPVHAYAHAPYGVGRVTCIGESTPVPDWRVWGEGMGTIPDCTGNVATHTDTARSVEVFDRAFGAPRSWRANLAWTSTVLNARYGIEAIYSDNRYQQGVYDLNFEGAQEFALGHEAARPVYVPASSIDAGSGMSISAASRRLLGLGTVMRRGSDLRSRSRQVSVTLTPDVGGSNRFLSASYTFAHSRASARGFDGAAAGDPRVLIWARGDYDIRHQARFQFGASGGAVTVTAFGLLSSGVPYTPVVDGDVNGDGLAGDAAFVHDPSKASDEGFAAGIGSLLQGPSGARRCLQRQVSRIAIRNSCEGPWWATMNVQLSVSPTATARLLRSRRPTISFYLTNPLAGIDELLHGRNMRGWGNPGSPDPTLLKVVGFDHLNGRFLYRINPHFGSSRDAERRRNIPFRVSLDVRVDLGRPLPQQQLAKWLNPGRGGRRGERLGADALAARYARSVPDFHAAILIQDDSLLLSAEQQGALIQSQTEFRSRMTRHWYALAVELAGLPGDYDVAATLLRQEHAIDVAWEMARAEAKTLGRILVPSQLKLLPWPASMLYHQDIPFGPNNRIRMFISG